MDEEQAHTILRSCSDNKKKPCEYWASPPKL